VIWKWSVDRRNDEGKRHYRRSFRDSSKIKEKEEASERRRKKLFKWKVRVGFVWRAWVYQGHRRVRLEVSVFYNSTRTLILNNIGPVLCPQRKSPYSIYIYTARAGYSVITGCLGNK